MENNLEKIKECIEREKKIIQEINLLLGAEKTADSEERKLIKKQNEILKSKFEEVNKNMLSFLESVSLEKIPQQTKNISIKKQPSIKEKKTKTQKVFKEKIPELDRVVIKRLKKKEKQEKEKKETKPSEYVKFASKLFSSKVREKSFHKKFPGLEQDLIKSHMGYTSVTYVSVMILTVLISLGVAFFIFLFFLFFNISSIGTITPMTEDFFSRFLKTFWVLIVIPVGVFLFMYLYPSMERKSVETKINQELPFATIHMAAISGAKIEPTKIFKIITMTKEYPTLEKELNKLLNEINVYGYDLVTALKDSATNSPSKKLADLFNGLAITITSGGDLYEFFDKRAQTLLFDYKLEREKETKAAETFMDIYISVVIAAPMILMLLLMMMKISGLGISISTSMLTILVVGGVSLINIFFLVFLQIKQQAGGGK